MLHCCYVDWKLGTISRLTFPVFCWPLSFDHLYDISVWSIFMVLKGVLYYIDSKMWHYYFLLFLFIYRQCWFCEIRYDKINELTPSCGSLLWCCVRSTFYWLRTSIRRGLKNNSKCNKFNVILERLLGMRSEKIVGNVEQRKYFSSQERRSIFIENL